MSLITGIAILVVLAIIIFSGKPDRSDEPPPAPEFETFNSGLFGLSSIAWALAVLLIILLAFSMAGFDVTMEPPI